VNRNIPPDRRELERRLSEHIAAGTWTYYGAHYYGAHRSCAACVELRRKLAEAIEREAPQDDEMERSRFERKGGA
jgi:hypothetical protein